MPEAKPKKPRAKRAPAKRAAKATGGRTGLRVKQVRSGIGHAETYRRTLVSLGIRHHQQEIVVQDTPAVRGMLHKVRHLVRVTPEEA